MHFSVKTQSVNKIKECGNSIRSGSVTVKYITHDEYRFSAIISKKQGNAVKRNKVKRIIRDIMMSGINKYPQGLYMIYFNRQCDETNRKNLMNDITNIMNKIDRLTV